MRSNKPLVLTAKSLRALVPSLRSAAAQRQRCAIRSGK
jgi:hypothetical protein